jgi:DNA polymerase-3 subunit delta
MKLAAARLEAFLARPDPEVGLVLLYGPDGGLVAERARRLARAVVDDLADPFRVSELDPDRLQAEPRLLVEEAQALCLVGGRRLVRVRPAGDGLSTAVRSLLKIAEPAALVLLEAGELGATSSLRRLVEAAPGAMALPCYRGEEREVAATVRRLLAEAGLGATPDALEFLVGHLGNDSGVTRQELAKLALYVGERADRSVRLEDAAAVIDDNAALAIDDVVRAAALGEADLELRLERLFAEGVRPEAVLRATVWFHLRLLRAALAVEAGASPDEALAALRPPLHFRARPAVARALRRWRPAGVVAALARLREAERECRRRHALARLVCCRALAGLAPAEAARPA